MEWKHLPRYWPFVRGRLNKRLSKQSRRRWFQTPSRSMCRHCNANKNSHPPPPLPLHVLLIAWWRHQMKTFSAFLAICVGNSPVTGWFPAQRPVTRSFGGFFYLRLNKRLNKQSWGWWFETLSRPLWPHCNGLLQLLLLPTASFNSSYSSSSFNSSIKSSRLSLAEPLPRIVYATSGNTKGNEQLWLWQTVLSDLYRFC